MLLDSRTNLDTLPPIRVMAFEATVDYWLSQRGKDAPPARVYREADHLRIEVGGWAMPHLVGCVSYAEIQAAPDRHLLAAEVSLCRPADVWWTTGGPPP